jgi:hypothetical protein
MACLNVGLSICRISGKGPATANQVMNAGSVQKTLQKLK